MTKANYEIEEQDRIGKQLAMILGLKRDPQNKSRWFTRWGNKTNVGIFNTIARLGSEIKDGTIQKLL